MLELTHHTHVRPTTVASGDVYITRTREPALSVLPTPMRSVAVLSRRLISTSKPVKTEPVRALALFAEYRAKPTHQVGPLYATKPLLPVENQEFVRLAQLAKKTAYNDEKPQ